MAALTLLYEGAWTATSKGGARGGLRCSRGRGRLQEVRVASTSARSRRHRRASMRSIILTGTLSSLVLVGSGLRRWALPNYVSGRITSVDAGTAGSASRGAMNILLVGVDKRDNLVAPPAEPAPHLGREVGQRTDTMMVVHVSEDHKKVTVVSLPRDTWTEIPGQGTHKINSAYQFGGAKLAVRAVQAATGMRINHYVEVNVLGFIDVVDSLGGVTWSAPRSPSTTTRPSSSWRPAPTTSTASTPSRYARTARDRPLRPRPHRPPAAGHLGHAPARRSAAAPSPTRSS